MRKKIIINIFLLAIMAFSTVSLIGFIIWNKPHRNIEDANAIEITAAALYQALSYDSSKMKMLFINRIVAVSGKVKQVQKNQRGQQVILLETNVKGASVNCTMEESSITLRAGEATKIKGICIGFINGDQEMGLPRDVLLTRCYELF